jgi:hypothetical protein
VIKKGTSGTKFHEQKQVEAFQSLKREDGHLALCTRVAPADFRLFQSLKREDGHLAIV